MILTLSAVSLNEQALSRPITARFDASGGTIGRADHSTMALPDPERFISRKQAEIALVGQGFVICNVGAANPINVGQRTLAVGEKAVLREGDEVRIGGYLLRAQYSRGGPGIGSASTVDPSAEATITSRAHLPVVPVAPVAPAPLQAADFGAPPQLSDQNPFADLLGPARPTPELPAQASPAAAHADPFADLMSPPRGIDPVRGQAAASSQAPSAQGALLPEDFDPFAIPAVPDERAAPPVPAMPGSPLPGSIEGISLDPGAARSIDQVFGLDSGTPPDAALAAFLSGTPAGASAAVPDAGLASSANDLLEGLGDVPKGPAVAPAPPPQVDNLSALHDAYVPPRVAAVPAQAAAIPAPRRPVAAGPFPTDRTPVAGPGLAASVAPGESARGRASVRAAPGPGAPPPDQMAALWHAFCEGAGVDLPVPAGDGAALMRHVGRILRASVDGTLQLMAVRASAKHEMRVAVTQIQASNNNPLKFAPDGAAGVEALLAPPQRGFLDGASAMDETMLDLVGHSIGTVAGMRAAIEGMLKRFEPEALEGKLGAGSPLSNLLPMNRKARLWELFLQHHRKIRDEAEEDFHDLFGRAFGEAYEQQVDRLVRQRRQQRRSADAAGR